MEAQVPISALDATIPGANGTVYTIDWEGAEAEIGIVNANFVAAVIYDNSAGNSRFATYLNTLNMTFNVSNAELGLGDPNPFASVVPSLRTGLITTNAIQTIYVLASGQAISQSAIGARVRLQLLTEPSFIDSGSGIRTNFGPLQVAGFLTDGKALPPRPLSTRRIEFLGDSLTAGYGAGFDVPAAPPGVSVSGGQLPCGAGVPINDVSMSYGSRLCEAFGADCSWVAVSGVTIMTGSRTLPDYWNLTLGTMINPQRWPDGVSNWNPCDASIGGGAGRIPDAVVINLGENDMHGAPKPPIPPSWYAKLAASYLAFIDTLWSAYNACSSSSSGNKGSPAFFLAIGPHEAGQSMAILQAMPQIAAAGYNVTFLNATVPPPPAIPAGCGGHPGPSLHFASAQKAAPVIAATMGWDYTGL